MLTSSTLHTPRRTTAKSLGPFKLSLFFVSSILAPRTFTCRFQVLLKDPKFVIWHPTLSNQILHGQEFFRQDRVQEASNRNSGGFNPVPEAKIWQAPNPGTHKINTDASFDGKKLIGSAGVVVRDYCGDLLTGTTRLFPINSPRVADAIAVQDAITLAKNVGLEKIIIESDSEEVISCCNKETQIGDNSQKQYSDSKTTLLDLQFLPDQ